MYSTTRRQLTVQDFEFIAKTLGSTNSERSSILHLTQDSESVTELLHHREQSRSVRGHIGGHDTREHFRGTHLG